MTGPMRRYCLASALLFSLLVLAASCGKTILQPTGAECEVVVVVVDEVEVEEADPAGCEGRACLVLNANVQGIVGICSEECLSDADCTLHERCITIEGSPFCLRACVTDGDCYDRTVCRLFAPGSASRFCLADPI
jgi:hypothetical protein